MQNESIAINVTADDKLFRGFAIYDNMRRKRIWYLPAVFASIMCAFALVCFAMRGRAEQAVMLGSVLLVIGLGLPAAYISLFFKSIKIQIKAARLEKPRQVYSLLLSSDRLQADVGGESLRYEWDGLSAHRAEGCVYLYVEKNKAFLLPDGQAEAGQTGEDVWKFLSARGVKSI